jgi:hypothetical protein
MAPFLSGGGLTMRGARPIRNAATAGEAGKFNLLTVLIAAGIIAGVLVGYKFLPPYSSDYSFKRMLDIQTRNAYEWPDEQIRKNIRDFAREESIQLNDEDWVVSRTDKEIFIQARYRVIVELPFNLSRRLTFRHDLRAEIKPKKEL